MLTYVPEDISSECRPLDRAESLHGERASLVCRTADLEVLYELFQTRDEMNEAFQVNLNNKSATEGECATDHLATEPYTIDGEPAGRLLCYTVVRGQFSAELPDQSHIEWTDDNSSIYAHAIRNDLGDLNLYEWWLTSSGPVLPSGGPIAQKDPPIGVAGMRLQDGIYLVAPPNGCAGFDGETCAMDLDGETYRIVFTNTPTETAEIGDLLLQKPDAIVFSPTAGYCFQGEQFGPPRNALPATYRWSGGGDTFTFERTKGGKCAGPQKLHRSPVTWTLAPDGVLAIEDGGEIELVNMAGSLVGSATETETNLNTWPDWSPDGSKIVFSGAGHDFDLYVMNADGADLQRITQEPGDEYTPAWSPRGNRIVFGFDDGGDPHWLSGLATVSPDGSGWTELLVRDRERVESPVWSPDGDRIAFTIFEDQGPTPYVLDPDQLDLVRLLDGPGVVLSWTPDARRILVSAHDSFVTVRPDGSGERVFLADPPSDGVLTVDWSPDGDWIVLSPPTGQTGPIYLMRADGSQIFQVGLGSEASWRPGSG